MKIKDFYIRSFTEAADTQFEETMMKQTIESFSNMAKITLDTATLSIEFELSIYCTVYGSVRLIKEWFLTENDLDEHDIARFITNSMNENLRELFVGYRRE